LADPWDSSVNRSLRSLSRSLTGQSREMLDTRASGDALPHGQRAG
jgi:hypothetical protein